MNWLRRLVISREGWYYLVVMAFLAGGATMRQINLLMLMFGMLAGPLLFNVWCVLTTLRPLRVRRKLPAAVCAGDPLVIELELTNTRRWGGAWAVCVEDLLVSDGRTQRRERLYPMIFFTHVAAGTTAHGVYRGRLMNRGRYRLGPLQLTTRFPFGLVRSSQSRELCDTLVVFPRLGHLKPSWHEQHREQNYEQSRRRSQRQGQFEGDFHSLRSWRPGDSRRWIHWRTSARRGNLMVRQFEQALAGALSESGQPERAAEQRESVELAVSFAATLCADACRRGGNHLLVGISGRELTLVRGAVSQSLLREALTELALAEHTSADRLVAMLSDAYRHLRVNSHTVLISVREPNLHSVELQSQLPTDSGFRTWLSRILVIPAGQPEQLGRYYEPEALESAAAV